ncbi:MAG: hypothetical protein JWN30_596 [Bacilli bacterium]|nr:hypothetical protein [Bacilli bacterium]
MTVPGLAQVLSQSQHPTAAKRMIAFPADLFEFPDLTLQEQMVSIILSGTANDQSPPKIAEISRRGRMSSKHVMTALQGIAEKKILPHKVFRTIVGEFGDDRLSWAAKGMLTYLKNNSGVKMQDLIELAEKSSDDERMIRNVLDELRNYGYLEDVMEEKSHQLE